MRRFPAHPRDLALWAAILRSMVLRGAQGEEFQRAISTLDHLARQPYGQPVPFSPTLTLKDLGL